jgi:hypothetical protein
VRCRRCELPSNMTCHNGALFTSRRTVTSPRRCKKLTTVCPLCVPRNVAACLHLCRTRQPQPLQNTASLPSVGPIDFAWSPCLDTRNCRARAVKEYTAGVTFILNAHRSPECNSFFYLVHKALHLKGHVRPVWPIEINVT